MTDLKLSFPEILKPIAFTLVVCICSFVGCMIWEYKTSGRHPNMLERAAMLKKYLGSWPKLEFWRNKIYYFLRGTHKKGKKLNEGQGVTALIIGCNLIVYLIWKIPRLHPILSAYFWSGPHSTLSCFAHDSIRHLFFNMMLLCVYSPKIIHILGREQFLAVYLSAGVFGYLLSYIYKVAIGSTALSIGSSSCIFGGVGFLYIHDPNPLRIFNIWVIWRVGHDIINLMLLEIVRWECDHAAHLGGFVFGGCYALWGRYIWEIRGAFLRWWKKIRGPRQPLKIKYSRRRKRF